MKLGTIIAFCGGAAVVFGAQHYMGTPPKGPASVTNQARRSESYEALALLKTTRVKPAADPKQVIEAPQETVETVQQEPSVVTEATPPGAMPPLPSETSAEPAVAEPTYTADDTSPSIGAPLDSGLSEPAFPSVSPKVADDFNLPKAHYQPPSDAAVAVPQTSAPSTLQTMVDTVRDVSEHITTVLAENAASPAVTLVQADSAPNKKSNDELFAEEDSIPVHIADQSAVAVDQPVSPPNPTPVAANPDQVPPQELVALKNKVRRVLDHHRYRMLNTRDYGAWETMHSLIPYGVEKEIQVGGPGGRKVNAIGWICFNGPSAGERLFTIGSAGPRGRTGPGLQGHEGQFLAMLAQSRVPATFPMKVEGRDFTVLDLVRQEQVTCRPNSELTFKLIGLMHYLKSDDVWRDENGGEWNIPRLIKEELAQPIVGATCGGTHRLFGLTYAYKKRAQRGEPVTGQYRRAQTYIQDFQDYTFKMQNPDGSFSTAFFAGRGASPDIARRLETSGHIAEWLAFSLDDSQLRDPRMVKAINYLATLLNENPEMNWKVGPLGHALHALNIYDSRVFEGADSPRSPSAQPAAPRTAAAEPASVRPGSHSPTTDANSARTP